MGRRAVTLAIVLAAGAAGVVACDLLMSDLKKGMTEDAGPDADVGEICPGYTGDDLCCTIDDWCMYADDGFCDCDGFCDWDESDCAPIDTDSDTDTDTETDTDVDSGVADAG